MTTLIGRIGIFNSLAIIASTVLSSMWDVLIQQFDD
jgi:hypothetical protein